MCVLGSSWLFLLLFIIFEVSGGYIGRIRADDWEYLISILKVS